MPKINRNDNCANGSHHFIPSRWLVQTSAGGAQQSQSVVSFTCQHCLSVVEGRNVLDEIAKHNEQLDAQNATENQRSDSKQKGSKSGSGKE